MVERSKLEVAYWPNPPGGLPTLRRTLRGRVYEFALPAHGWLSVYEVAAVLGKDPATVWRWIQGENPRFAVKRKGGRWWIKALHVARYLKQTRPTEKGTFLTG
jgi:hypothetical protein